MFSQFLILWFLCSQPVGVVFYEKTKESLKGPVGEAFTDRPNPPAPFLEYPKAPKIELPNPKPTSMTLFEALMQRRSKRSYTSDSLTLEELSALLFAAQGVTKRRGKLLFRTAPSAGALYPIELFIAVKRVKGLKPGLYHYSVRDHVLEFIREDGKIIDKLYRSALWQRAVKDAAAVMIISAIVNRTRSKYGERGWRYVYMEAGHVSQNIYLMATALQLGTVAIGAFADDEVNSLLGLNGRDEITLYLQPVGYPLH